MKIKLFFFFAGLLLLGWSLLSCCGKQCNQSETKAEVMLQDYGAEPTVINIEDFTLFNENFRTALWTGTYLQLTLMSIPVGGEIGLEQHCDTDQFLRIEEGEGKVLMGDTEEALTFEQIAGKDFVIFVPAGKWHNLINTGKVPIKLYSIYAPAEHQFGTVHKTFEEAEEAEHHH
jgi:mannose-6-phosphate isomerase-like protein (cupin superfamily)